MKSHEIQHSEKDDTQYTFDMNFSAQQIIMSQITTLKKSLLSPSSCKNFCTRFRIVKESLIMEENSLREIESLEISQLYHKSEAHRHNNVFRLNFHAEVSILI